MMKGNTRLKYCLYARKSSESDERQAMSIDGQLSEMKSLAKREKLNVVETTPHNTGDQSPIQYGETHIEMLKEYLLHVLQFGTPEERLKILKGVNSKFSLRDRQLNLQ